MARREKFAGPGRTTAVRKKWLRKLKSRQVRARRRGARWSYSSLRQRMSASFSVRVKAPVVWGLHHVDERKDMGRFLSELKTVCLNGESGVVIDFSQTERITPAGGMLVHAELYRLSRLVRGRGRLRCRGSSHDVADQVLKQIGVYELLNFSSSVRVEDQSVVHWRHATGLRVEGEVFGTVTEHIEGELSTALQSSLYRGITEAMTNAVQHAYVSSRRDGFNHAGEKRWWIFSQERDGFLTVVFCDLGIGIPNSLPLKPDTKIKEILAKFKPSRSDLESIRLATELGKTSTFEPNRGTGLPEILDAARKAEQGNCVIYSNRGQYGFGTNGRAIENQFQNSIYGTLIEWRVPLTEGVAE